MFRILMLVDVQVDFLTGALGNPEAVKRKPNIIKLINDKEYDYILLTRDTHFDDYLTTYEGKRLDTPHCIKDTDGWQIDSEVMEAVKASGKPYRIIDKRTFGYDGWAGVLNDIRYEGYDYGVSANIRLDVGGYCTGLCVEANATTFQAAAPNAEIFIHENCCACLTPDTHENALKSMELRFMNVIR